MGIFRTNDPTQFDDIDGIIIDEQSPPSRITGVNANTGILVGQFQRGPESLSLPIASLGDFQEVYGNSNYSGNKQLRNKAFGALRIARVVASDAEFASLTVQTDLHFQALYKGSYGNNLSVKIDNASNDTFTPGVAARFSGTVAGVTGNVEIESTIPGIEGNNIELTGDGTDDLNDLVAEWNTNNPDLPIRLLTTNGTQVPNTGETIMLSGGVGSMPLVDAGIKITVRDRNPGATIPIEVHDNLNVADLISGAQLLRSRLIGFRVTGTPTTISTTTSTVLTGGSDGTIVDADYESAIATAEVERSGNVLFLDEYNSVRNLLLRTHASLTQDKMVICCGAELDDRDAAIQEAGNLRDADGRVIYAWPYIETLINGVPEYTPPASWLASIYTQTAPHVALSYTQNTRFLGGVTDLRFKTGRQGHASLDAAGVASFERDSDIGFLLKNAVTTQIINTSKREIIRRRMADFLQNSVGLALKNWQNDVNSFDKRDEIKGAVLDFDTRLVISNVLPGAQDVTDGSPVLVDTESLNTDSVIASGQFKLLYRRRIFSSMRYIVLQAEIGTGVVVTEV